MSSFNDFALSPELRQAIADLGFETPSPVQAMAVPILLGEPTDFLGLATTGTGKTAAFGIPLLEKMSAKTRHTKALVLCPTRELALQVSGQLDKLGRNKGLRSLPVYGGTAYQDQTRGLRQGAPVVVGTPGRLIDHLERGNLDLSQVETVILDEADEMISMGFKEDLEKIMTAVDREKARIWLFSATMSREIRHIADEYLRSPQTVQSNRNEVLPAKVQQIFYITRESNKRDVLVKLIEAADDFYGLVFCQMKVQVAELTEELQHRGHRVDCLHGDMTQVAREKTMQNFRDRRCKILICTDVASRGLDVKDISHVINFSVPRELDTYVHRVGRTARSGKEGFAMSLVTPTQRFLIGKIERVTKSRMLEGEIPSRKQIGERKVSRILSSVTGESAPSATSILQLMTDEARQSLEGLTREEIAGRFLALLLPDLGAMSASVGESKPKKQRPERGEYSDRPVGFDGPRAPRPRDENLPAPIPMKKAAPKAAAAKVAVEKPKVVAEEIEEIFEQDDAADEGQELTYEMLLGDPSTKIVEISAEEAEESLEDIVIAPAESMFDEIVESIEKEEEVAGLRQSERRAEKKFRAKEERVENDRPTPRPAGARPATDGRPAGRDRSAGPGGASKRPWSSRGERPAWQSGQFERPGQGPTERPRWAKRDDAGPAPARRPFGDSSGRPAPARGAKPVWRDRSEGSSSYEKPRWQKRDDSGPARRPYGDSRPAAARPSSGWNADDDVARPRDEAAPRFPRSTGTGGSKFARRDEAPRADGGWKPPRKRPSDEGGPNDRPKRRFTPTKSRE